MNVCRVHLNLFKPPHELGATRCILATHHVYLNINRTFASAYKTQHHPRPCIVQASLSLLKMVGFLSLLSAALTLSSASFANAGYGKPYSIPNTWPDLSKCTGLPLQYSCENTTAFANSCCSVAKGGLVLQTQFWDTYTVILTLSLNAIMLTLF